MVAAKYQRENMTRTNLLIITAMFGVFFLIGKQSNQQEITELKLKLEVSE
jgi:heme/copper-type cytochrome/quinol oxidase subunit 3